MQAISCAFLNFRGHSFGESRIQKNLALGSLQKCTFYKKRHSARMQGTLVIYYSLGWSRARQTLVFVFGIVHFLRVITMSSDDFEPDGSLVDRMSTVAALASNIAQCPLNPSPNTHNKFFGLVQELVYQANMTADYIATSRSHSRESSRPPPPRPRLPHSHYHSRSHSASQSPSASRSRSASQSGSASCSHSPHPRKPPARSRSRSHRSQSRSSHSRPRKPPARSRSRTPARAESDTPSPIRERFLVITEKDKSCTSPKALFEHLTSPSDATNEEQENASFRRLIHGYQAASLQVWACPSPCFLPST